MKTLKSGIFYNRRSKQHATDLFAYTFKGNALAF